MKWNDSVWRFFLHSISSAAAVGLKINQNAALYAKKGYKMYRFRLTKCKSRQVLTCHLIITYCPVCLLHISTLKVSGLKVSEQMVIAHADIPSNRSSNSCLLIELHSDSAAAFDPQIAWYCWYCCWSDLKSCCNCFSSASSLFQTEYS